MTSAPLRLRLDSAALIANWHTLDRMSGGAACGAAVKADGYGLGAVGVAQRLTEAGCRDLFVATWTEAVVLAEAGLTGSGLAIAVLHGPRAGEAFDLPGVRPVLNTPAQVQRWRERGGGPCDVMIDTGINRLGLSPTETGLLDGLAVETLLSHLACADEASPMNARQRDAFAGLQGRTQAKRMSLSNSAGIALGPDYRFDLTRPGIALYGGRQVAGHAAIRQVVAPEAEVLQRRTVPAGATIGYNAIWTAPADTEAAILNIGYADGYWRSFSNRGHALAGERKLPVLGRVSMDLLAVDVSAAPELAEGDWVSLAWDLPETSALSGMSQYELLTGLGARFERVWV